MRDQFDAACKFQWYVINCVACKASREGPRHHQPYRICPQSRDFINHTVYIHRSRIHQPYRLYPHSHDFINHIVFVHKVATSSTISSLSTQSRLHQPYRLYPHSHDFINHIVFIRKVTTLSTISQNHDFMNPITTSRLHEPYHKVTTL